ncbi:MAG: GNAT family N-acetyltransferase [Deinococcales bacterium]
MGDTARDAARAEMARAVEANLYAFGEEFERLQGVETYRGEDMQWCLTDEPFPLFNAVFDIHLTPESADRTIAAVLARARERGVSLLWYTGPSSTPADLGERLEAAGLQPGGTSPGMALELEDLREPPPLPRGVSIERVTDERTLRRWCRVAMEGFQMPDAVETTLLELSSATALAPDPSMHHYLGLHEGRPVACSTLFYGAGSAGIYNVATLPSARRQGFGRALTYAPLADARAAGHRLAVLQASEMGAPLYRAMGFEDVCTLRTYVWAAGTADVS